MKKITLLLLMLFSITAFSQIEIVENFDGISSGQIPANWTTNPSGSSGFRVTNSNFIGCGSAFIGQLHTTAGSSSSFTTQNFTGISNGTALTVSFSYNVFAQVSQFPPVQYVSPTTDWGSIVVEYSTDGGTNWNTITTITDADFTYTSETTCEAVSVPVGIIPNGSDFQARFTATTTNIVNFAQVFIIDDVSFTQVPTTAPNCDAQLTSPANGATDLLTDVTLEWNTATGLPDGYKVSVGTTSGGTDIANEVNITATSYDLTGLNWNTQYFVNIIPFNANGDASSGCVEETFTTRTEPIEGATCETAFQVTSFPYLNQNDTANFEDLYDSGPCSNSYMNGKDVFYEINPTMDMSINVEVSGIDNNGAGVHVVQDCIDTATTCLDWEGTFSSNGSTYNLNDLVLSAGNTYYVVLSNSSNSRTYNYNLLITQNSCINPTMTLSNVPDCNNSQYFVDVDVTYLGDATSLTLTDSEGNSNPNITATGVVQMGPYTSDSTITFALTNDQDSSCFFNDSTFFYCPPSNDECTGAISLTANTDDTCTITTSGTNAGATESMGFTSGCNAGAANDVWYSFVATAENMFIEYTNKVAIVGSSTSMRTEILEGSCGSLTSLTCSLTDYVPLNNLTVGNTYYIRNYGAFSGNQQSFDVCLSNFPSPPANDDCSNAIALSLSTDSNCGMSTIGTTVGATNSPESNCNDGDVWYTFTPATDGAFLFDGISGSEGRMQILEGTCAGGFTAISGSCNTNVTTNQTVILTGNTTYYVMVRNFSSSNPGSPHNICVYQLPDPAPNSDCSTPITFSESPDSNGANKITGNLDNAYYSPEGACSTTYESVWYEFTPTLTGTYNFELTRISGTTFFSVYDSNNCDTIDYLGGDINSCFENSDDANGTDQGPVVAGNTYLVSIQGGNGGSFEFFAYPEPSLTTADVELDNKFTYYPNPVEDSLNIEAKNIITNISVYNMLGQKVEEIAPNSLSQTLQMNSMTKGVYFVSITINNTTNTIRVVKR